jgi:hypothetical protein
MKALAYMLFIQWRENAQLRATCAFWKSSWTPKLVEIVGDFCGQNAGVAASLRVWSVSEGNAA